MRLMMLVRLMSMRAPSCCIPITGKSMTMQAPPMMHSLQVAT